VGFDELTNWATDYCYIFMHTCARSAAGVPVRVRASGNPGSVGHVWVKQRFVDIGPSMQPYADLETGLQRIFIPAYLEDNIRLVEKDPEYEARLKMQPKHIFRAYRYGDWDIFAGQVFEEFTRDRHVKHPFAIQPTWYRFASLDWGYNKPYSIGWWAVTSDGRMIRYREMYGCDKDKHNVGTKESAIDVATEAWAISVAEGCVDMVADPSCWSKLGTNIQKDQPASIAEIFAAAGWRMEKGINDRKSGLQRMHDMLKTDGHDGLPMMIIFNTCLAFIRTVPTLVADVKHPEDLDTSGEDHVYDESRYACMSRVAKDGQIRQKSTIEEHEEDEESMEEFDALNWGLKK